MRKESVHFILPRGNFDVFSRNIKKFTKLLGHTVRRFSALSKKKLPLSFVNLNLREKLTFNLVHEGMSPSF
mgnify:CR=1 FL=1